MKFEAAYGYIISISRYLITNSEDNKQVGP